MNKVVILLLVSLTLPSQARADALFAVPGLPTGLFVKVYIPHGWAAIRYQEEVVELENPRIAAVGGFESSDGSKKGEIRYLTNQKYGDINEGLHTFVNQANEYLGASTVSMKNVAIGDGGRIDLVQYANEENVYAETVVSGTNYSISIIVSTSRYNRDVGDIAKILTMSEISIDNGAD